MDTINISLPLNLQAFVHQQTSQGGYGSAHAYIEELIRRDQEQKHRSWLEEEVIKIVECGATAEITEQVRNAVRQEVREHLVNGGQLTVEEELIKGLDSAAHVEMTPEVWQAFDEMLERRIAYHQRQSK